MEDHTRIDPHHIRAKDRIARFNAKKFLSFQLAKLLDTVQNSFRPGYQALNFSYGTQVSKGPYPVFDDVTAVFPPRRSSRVPPRTSMPVPSGLKMRFKVESCCLKSTLAASTPHR